MSKKETKHDNLPKHQRRIVLCLAKEGPLIITETNKKLKGEYTSTNRAFHKLEKKGLIQRVGIRPYRGQEFPRYWLTFESIIFSILEGANIDKLLSYAKECLPKNVDTDRVLATIESAKYLDPRLLQHLYSLLRQKEQLQPMDIVLLTIQAGMTQGITFEKGIEQMKIIMNVFEKYPRLNKELKDAWKDTKKVIHEVERVVKP